MGVVDCRERRTCCVQPRHERAHVGARNRPRQVCVLVSGTALRRRILRRDGPAATKFAEGSARTGYWARRLPPPLHQTPRCRPARLRSHPQLPASDPTVRRPATAADVQAAAHEGRATAVADAVDDAEAALDTLVEAGRL